jgi:Domain of unknown function (DUF4124)
MRRLAWLAAFLAFCAHAEVYKWVDEKGQVQYGEQPPAGAAATKMNVPAAAGTAEAPSEKPKEPAVNKAPTKEERTTRCDFEREQQKLLDAEAPVIYKDAKGEMVALDEAKRAAAKERVRDNVKKYCS